MRAGIVVAGFSVSLLSVGALADKAVEVCRQRCVSRATLPLVWIDVHGIAREARSVATAEATALLEPAGIHIEWDLTEARERMAREGEVHVIVLPSPPPSLHPHVMGAAQPTAEGIRVLWVYASAVRAALGLDPRATAALKPTDARRFGRALGRVILHEVVHVAAPHRPHARRGLMAAQLSRSTLEGGIALEPELVEVFRLAAIGPERGAGGATAIAALGPLVVD